jgi:hypothetical protein
MGATLSYVLMVRFWNAQTPWTAKGRWIDRALRLKYLLRPCAWQGPLPELSNGRILVTWLASTPRLSELVLPVIAELGPEKCQVLCRNQDMLSQVPEGAERLAWEQALLFDPSAWRAEYRRCWPQWKRCLRALCREHNLPTGAYERLSLCLFIASQQVAGCLGFLARYRPAAVLTEHDRNDTWSCLVLAARKLGIPTFTMVHGLTDEKGTGYIPFLADKAFCWGVIDRERFQGLGEPPEKLLVAGCARLDRDLLATPAEGRRKLGLPPDKPVVMLGSGIIGTGEHLKMARLFCEAAKRSDRFSAVVRLHPVEKLDAYSALIAEYPQVVFSPNAAATLDEAMAAADIVVFRVSGLGSDALVKGRLAIVFDVQDFPLGPAAELMRYGGCPRATTADELVEWCHRLLFNESERAKHHELADQFVRKFCVAFGPESARRIAGCVLEAAELDAQREHDANRRQHSMAAEQRACEH